MAGKIIQVPSVSTAERDSLVSPPVGAMIYHNDTMAMEYTSDGGSTWNKISDILNSSPKNIVYWDPTDGDDTIGTGRISSPFKTLSHTASTIITSSFSNPFLIQMVSSNSTETGVVDIPPGVTIDGGGGIFDLSGGTLQLRSAAWNGITDGFFNLVNFEKLSLPDCTLDLSNTIGPTTISIINITPFNNFPTITINGSSTNYSNLYIQNIIEGDTQILFNLNNINMFVNNTSFADTTITVNNGLGYQHKFNNSANFNVFNVNVDGESSQSFMTCNTFVFNSNPVFNASNGGEINYHQVGCSGGAATFDNTAGTGGTITAGLGIVTNVPISIGTPTVNYNIVLGDALSLIGESVQVGDYSEAGTLSVTLSGGVVSMNTAGAPTLTLDGGSEVTTLGGGTTIVSGNGELTLQSSGGNVNVNSAIGSHINLTTTDGNDESASGPINLTTGSCEAELGGASGTINIKTGSTPDGPVGSINIQTQNGASGGSINILTGNGNGSDNAINIKTDPLGGTGGAITIQSDNQSVNIQSGNAVMQLISGSANITTDSGELSLDSQSGLLHLRGEAHADLLSPSGDINITADGKVTIFGEGDQTLQSGSNNVNIIADTDVSITPSNALQVTAGGNVNITSTGTDIVLTASSGSLEINANAIGLFGSGPVTQSPPIADASVLLTDVVTQFNTLLAYLRSRGDIDT